MRNGQSRAAPSTVKTEPYTASGSMGLEETALAEEALYARPGEGGRIAIGERSAGSARSAASRRSRWPSAWASPRPTSLATSAASVRLHGDMIAEIARILDVSSDELLGLKPAAASSAHAAAEERRLWKHLRRIAQLPERDQRAVFRFIDSASALRGGAAARPPDQTRTDSPSGPARAAARARRRGGTGCPGAVGHRARRAAARAPRRVGADREASRGKLVAALRRKPRRVRAGAAAARTLLDSVCRIDKSSSGTDVPR